MTTAGSHADASWRPTLAYFRAAVGAIVLIVCALIFRRPDLLVIATPFARADRVVGTDPTDIGTDLRRPRESPGHPRR